MVINGSIQSLSNVTDTWTNVVGRMQ